MGKKKTAKRAKPRGVKKPTAAPQVAATATPIDRELALSGLKKKQAGAKQSREEIAALRRVQAATQEEQLRKHLTSIPKKLYVEYSGRQTKVINEQGRRLGLPIDKPTISLAELLPALHDLLAANKDRIVAAGQASEVESLAGEQQQEKLLTQRLKNKKLERELERDDDQYVAVADIGPRLDWLKLSLREFGQRLGRQFGGEAQTMLNDLLSSLVRELEEGQLSNYVDPTAGGHHD